MRFRGWLLWSAVAASLLAPGARAQGFNERRFNLVPFVGWTAFDSELKRSPGPMFRNDFYFGGRASARLVSIFWLDLAGGITSAKPCNCNQTWSHYTGNLMLMGVKPRRIYPFISVGGGISQFKPMITADKRDGVAEAAGGFRVRLSDGMGLRLEARNTLLVPKTDWFKKAHIDNTVLGAGLVYAFGGRPPDSDGDGVPDKRDKCPDTPHGCKVDANGCPIDSDGDGVCDGIDQCPNTPAGAKVDAKGCPTDSDGDGVYDGIDQCPDSPKGCVVDAKGCPVDSDGDGVCDGIDQCPNTPAGAKVDAKGCPIPVSEKETELLDTGTIRLNNVQFETAKWDIKPESYPVLDEVGTILVKWPQLRIEIGGHTDWRGSELYNQQLSEKRARAVLEYLTAKFSALNPSQYSARGYGEIKPIASNKTASGMAQNRRVEFRVLNREVLRKEIEKRKTKE